MRYVIEGARNELLVGVAEDFADALIGLQKAGVEAGYGDAYGSLIEDGAKAFFAGAQRFFGGLPNAGSQAAAGMRRIFRLRPHPPSAARLAVPDRYFNHSAPEGRTRRRARGSLGAGSYFFLRRVLVRLRGTFAPERRASDSPMAIACLRLFTLRPERPLRRV